MNHYFKDHTKCAVDPSNDDEHKQVLELDHHEESSFSLASSYSRGSSSCLSFTLEGDEESAWSSLPLGSSSSSSSEQEHFSRMQQQKQDQWLRFVEKGMQWKDVQNRFHRIVSPSSSCHLTKAVAAADASTFAFLIGMEQEPEFANELLAALRRRMNVSMKITAEELHHHWCRITHPSYDSKLRLFFDMCDRDMDGKITSTDLKQMIVLSASVNKVSMTKEEAEIYASLLMHELNANHKGNIEFNEFKSLFNLIFTMRGFGEEASTDINPVSCYYNDNNSQIYQERLMSEAEILFGTYWRRAWIIMLWLSVCAALFYWKFVQYSQRQAFQVMGYCVSAAKGAAETLKFNMALILLPVCRNTITWLRSIPWVNHIIPFNDNLNFHKLIAGGIVVGVILHGGVHLSCDFPRITRSNPVIFQMTIGSRFQGIQPSYLQILGTMEVLTGISMVILMAITFSLATKIPRTQPSSLPKSIRDVTGYNTFWYSHHMLIIVYMLLIVHSIFLFLTSNAAEKTTWIYIAVPVLIYMGERIHRSMRSELHQVDILKVSMYPGKVISLVLSKPEGFTYQSGMYIYIKCPQISYLEWHPFSLTSAPEDIHLSVHIRTAGDWSSQMYNLFNQAVIWRRDGLTHYYPRVQIDGPYGAPSQDHTKYDVVVMIGLGIGATPFISILKELRLNPKLDQNGENTVRAYLYWVTREQDSLGWFREAMNETSDNNLEKQELQRKVSIDINTYLTSVYESGDARSVMLSVIQALHFIKNGTDIFSQTQVRTHFARPHWFRILSSLTSRHAGSRIGVFYCGCASLAKELESLCTGLSTKTTTRFVFHKENY